MRITAILEHLHLQPIITALQTLHILAAEPPRTPPRLTILNPITNPKNAIAFNLPITLLPVPAQKLPTHPHITTILT